MVPGAGMNSTEKYNKEKHCLLCITVQSCEGKKRLSIWDAGEVLYTVHSSIAPLLSHQRGERKTGKTKPLLHGFLAFGYKFKVPGR